MATDDLFSLNLQYDQANAGLGATAQYDGNIASLSWQVKGGIAQTYGYSIVLIMIMGQLMIMMLEETLLI